MTRWPDPYACQRCGKLYRYLDLMGGPTCDDCGGQRFWPVPTNPELRAFLERSLAAESNLCCSACGDRREPSEITWVCRKGGTTVPRGLRDEGKR